MNPILENVLNIMFIVFKNFKAKPLSINIGVI